jgi:isopentenyl-diphosphate delta-isomerase
MTQKTYPNITAVDDNDEVVGYLQLFPAIALGHRRRLAVVFVFDDNHNILVQRRGAHVLSPNLLDFSAGGHVNEGDDYRSTAQSELSEELGITNVPLTLVTPPFPTPGFYTAVYKTTISNDSKLNINHEEVAEVFWVTFEEFKRMVNDTPEHFTEPFLAIWAQVYDKMPL